MSTGFFTRPDLDDRQFKQLSGSTLNLSGETNFGGILKSKGVEVDGSTVGASTGWTLTWNGTKIALSPSTGGGGGQEYTGASPTNITVGGLAAGTDISTMTLSEIIEAMVITTFFPTLTNPNNSFAEDQANVQEVGTIIPAIGFTASFSQGSINPQYPPTASPYRSGPPNTYNYSGSGLPLSVLSTSLTDNQVVNNYKMLLNANTWTNTVSYDAGVQPYDSSGNPYNSPLPAGTTGSKGVTLTGRYIRFYGATVATPTTSGQVRGLPQSDFQTSNVNVFDLNTGAVLIKFVVALPPSRTISQVIDLDALNANITSQYVYQGTITVNDGGGTGDPHSYNLYEMNIGAPYSGNHRHQITTA